MRRLTKALLGTAIAFAMLAVVEVGLRVVLGPPPPPVKVYRVDDALEGYIREVKPGVGEPTFQRNSPNPSFTRKAERPRFAVVGGSSVHLGTRGIKTTEQFPGLLEQRTGYEVLNLGAPAFDSHEIAELVEEAVTWDLDGLVVYTGHNDIGNTWFFERYGSTSSKAQAVVLSVLENFQIYCQLRRALDSGTFIAGDAHKQVRPEPNKNIQTGLSQERHAVALRYFRRNLERIAFLCRRNDVELILVTPASNAFTSPNSACTNPPECAIDYFQAAQNAFRSDPVQAEAWYRHAVEIDEVPVRATSAVTDIVREVAADEGAILVDAEKQLTREDPLDLPLHTLFQDHMHFSRSGQKEMTDLLEPVLRQVVEQRGD